MRHIILLILTAGLLQLSVAQSADDATAAANMGADYILRTELFKGLAQVELPAEISLPGFIKITKLRVSGLDNVSRSCNLQLRPVGAGKSAEAEAKTCIHIKNISGSFVVQMLGQSLIFITISIADFRARVTLHANLVPGGALKLESFDAWLGPIQVTNNGLIGDLVSKALQVDAVREQIRLTVVNQLGLKIREALKTVTLPK